MKTMIATILAALLLGGCMTKREYQLRSRDLKAKAEWPATYTPVSIKGPLTIPEGGELIVTVPNMPYTPANIPDGQAIQASLAKDALHTAALLGGAVYSIHKASGGSSRTTINNNGGETP
jgi:hypothetical protein